MKKIILTVAAVFVLGFANAQDKKESKGFGFSKGDVYVEGNINMDSKNDKDANTKTSSMNFSPSVGYFLSDNFAVGLNLDVTSAKTTVSGTDTAKNNGFGVGAYGRYYFLEVGQRFKTYTQFGFNVGSSKDAISTYKTNTFDLGAGLGMNYFVTPKVAISFGLGNVISYGNTKMNMPGMDQGSSEMKVNLNVFNNFFNTPTFGALYKF
jgi:outer membrane protein